MDINKVLATEIACDARGSNMGRRTVCENTELPLLLQKVRLYDGCYDKGGAYWGGPNNLYCAFNTEGTFRMFTRAENRHKAKAAIVAAVKSVKFKK